MTTLKPNLSHVLHIDKDTGNYVEDYVGERFSVTATPSPKPWVATTTYTIKGKKLGKEVTLYLPQITGTSATDTTGLDTITFAALIPSGFRPAANRAWPVVLKASSTATEIGIVDIQTDGSVIFSRVGTSLPDFPGSAATVGALATSIEYSTEL